MVCTITVAFSLVAVSQFKPKSQEKPQTQQSLNIVSTFIFLMEWLKLEVTA